MNDYLYLRIDYTSIDNSLYFLAGTFCRLLRDSNTIKRFRYASESMKKEEFTKEFIERKKVEWIKHLEERLSNYEK